MTKTVLHILSGDLWAGKETQILLQSKPFLTDKSLSSFTPQFLLFNDGDVVTRFRETGFQCTVVSEKQSIYLFLRELTRTAKGLAPDIVYAHGYKEAIIGWIVARAVRKPLVVMFHGAPEPFSGIAAARMLVYSLLHRTIAKLFASRVVTVSEALAKELSLIRSKKLVVIRNVVNVEKQLANARPHFQLKHPALILVGRLTPVKAIDRALVMFARFISENRSGHLYIVGDGAISNALQRLAGSLRLDDSVNFLGFRGDAASLIAEADLLLIPSLREGIPTVLLEAIAAGVPVLSNTLPGVMETLNFFPGYPAICADSADTPAWVSASEQLLREKSGQNSRYLEIIKANFSPEVAAAKHFSLLTELLP